MRRRASPLLWLWAFLGVLTLWLLGYIWSSAFDMYLGTLWLPGQKVGSHYWGAVKAGFKLSGAALALALLWAGTVALLLRSDS